ncbi:tetratricopeptide repeat protein [Hyphobacterium sp. HN65]|uniref:Tetratricopeptide repeat protein n=1 Tax=Hyphobacterium lacteum TaxID=3116575 RepID=A0ABU7LN53_9PROT|nr:tetratricopeptide repeat protein [Hyphobacterium sp. HN65]MEE2525312.1 tetratricopeptide repeat protein [Hyphobacterium sp. HN65]
MIRFVIAGIAASVISGAAMAQSMVVIGNTPASQCYENALWQRAYSSALQPCDLALASDELSARDRHRTLVNRAVIFLHLERPEEALADLDLAHDSGFVAPEIDMNRSAALIRLERYEEAVEAATLALEGGLRDEEKAYFNRAVAYERMGRIAQAYDDFRAATARAPDWDEAREQLERFRVSNGI